MTQDQSSLTRVHVRVFGETDDFYPCVIALIEGDLVLVNLLPDGPAEGARVQGISPEQAKRLLKAQVDDPYDIILAAQKLNQEPA